MARCVIAEILHALADVLHASATARNLLRMRLPEVGNDRANVLDLSLASDFVGCRLVELIAGRAQGAGAILA